LFMLTPPLASTQDRNLFLFLKVGARERRNWAGSIAILREEFSRGTHRVQL